MMDDLPSQPLVTTIQLSTYLSFIWKNETVFVLPLPVDVRPGHDFQILSTILNYNYKSHNYKIHFFSMNKFKELQYVKCRMETVPQ
jgi:hypothetical protein